MRSIHVRWYTSTRIYSAHTNDDSSDIVKIIHFHIYFQGLTNALPAGLVAPTPIISRVILPPPQTQATNLSLKSQPTMAVATSHENGIKQNNVINSNNVARSHTGMSVPVTMVVNSSGGGMPPSTHPPPPLTPPAAHTKNQINHNNNKIPLQPHHPTSPSPSPLIKVPHYTAHRPSILQVTFVYIFSSIVNSETKDRNCELLVFCTYTKDIRRKEFVNIN